MLAFSFSPRAHAHEPLEGWCLCARVMRCHICSFVTCFVPDSGFEIHTFVSCMIIPVFAVSRIPHDYCDTRFIGSLTNRQLSFSSIFINCQGSSPQLSWCHKVSSSGWDVCPDGRHFAGGPKGWLCSSSLNNCRAHPWGRSYKLMKGGPRFPHPVGKLTARESMFRESLGVSCRVSLITAP